MKRKLMVLALVIQIILTSTFSNQEVEAATIKRYGISYDYNKYLVTWRSKNYVRVYNYAGYLMGTMQGVFGDLRYKKKIGLRYNHTMAVKLIMTPKSEKVKCSGYSLSEYASVKCTLPKGSELEDYTPKNEPAKNHFSLSAGINSGKQASIGVSYDIEASDLDITSRCNTGRRLCYTVYNYIPSLKNPFANNKYVSNESCQYAFYDYNTSTRNPRFTIELEARFGHASDSKRSPWLIYPGSVAKSTEKFTYTY